MDEKLASAISHWGPRFTTNGITVADFERVTHGLDRWSDWCAAWSTAAAEHEQLGRTALADGRTRSAGEHLAMAATYFHFAKFVFVEDYEQMRTAHQNAVRCLDDALPHLDPPGRRVEVPFDGATMVGILRVPAGDGPHPAVLLIPGLDSTKEEFRSTEKTFLDRGLATFSVDGPGQGEAEYDLPIRGDWSAPGPGVPRRAGRAAGGRRRPARHLGRQPRRLLRAARRGRRRRPDPGRGRAGRPVQLRRLLGPAAAAHPGHLPGALAGRGPTTRRGPTRRRWTWPGWPATITAPLLVVTGKLDRLIPYQHAERLAGEAKDAELLLLPDGNHGCMNVWPKHRPYTADWLARHLTA